MEGMILMDTRIEYRISDTPAKELPHKPNDVFNAEFALTQVELQYHLKQNGTPVVTSETLSPFKSFLDNRWRRIADFSEEVKEAKQAKQEEAGTDLMYFYAANYPANQLCLDVAKVINQIEIEEKIQSETHIN